MHGVKKKNDEATRWSKQF